MLRETGGTIRRPPTGECDCGILEDVVVGLNGVIGEDTDAEVIEEGKRAPNCSNVISLKIGTKLNTFANNVLSKIMRPKFLGD